MNQTMSDNKAVQSSLRVMEMVQSSPKVREYLLAEIATLQEKWKNEGYENAGPDAAKELLHAFSDNSDTDGTEGVADLLEVHEDTMAGNHTLFEWYTENLQKEMPELEPKQIEDLVALFYGSPNNLSWTAHMITKDEELEGNDESLEVMDFILRRDGTAVTIVKNHKVGLHHRDSINYHLHDKDEVDMMRTAFKMEDDIMPGHEGCANPRAVVEEDEEEEGVVVSKPYFTSTVTTPEDTPDEVRAVIDRLVQEAHDDESCDEIEIKVFKVEGK